MLKKTSKLKLIIWGGFWEKRLAELEIHELNSHASVTCFFLTKELRREFDIIQIPGFYSIANALNHPDAVAVLSTFQAGFTRLRQDDSKLFHEIKTVFKNKLYSIVDFVSFRSYAEDCLFSILPINNGFKQLIKSLKSGATISDLGWCAAPDICTPNLNETDVTIFLDHAHYAGDDYSHIFIKALNQLSRSEKIGNFKVLYQGNRGIEHWILGQNWHNELYNRGAKVPWVEIQQAYAKSHIFCVTHKESAGLGVIEAAMSGAHILVPYDKTPFIRQELLDSGISHSKIRLDVNSIIAALKQIIIYKKYDRLAQHEKLRQTHSWAVAAQNISRSVFSKI